MGSFIWVLHQKVYCRDGVAVGTMRISKTFTPWPTLLLQNCGIFRNAQNDADAEEIVSVGWVDTPQMGVPGYFRVDLADDETDLPYHQARALYGTHFEWTFTPKTEDE